MMNSDDALEIVQGNIDRLRRILLQSAYSYHTRDHNHLEKSFKECDLYMCKEAREALDEC